MRPMLGRLHRRIAALAMIASLSGCYASHQHEREVDAGPPPLDAGDVDPCGTICDGPSILARLELDVDFRSAPAVLGAVVHRDELVAVLLLASSLGPGHPDVVETPFALARISRRTGEARIETVPAPADVSSVAAATLASDGETLTLVALYDEVPETVVFPPPTDAQPLVLVARWDGDGAVPTMRTEPLTDAPLPRCARCLRRGASVALTGTRAVAALAAEGVLHVARVDLDGTAVRRDAVAIADVTANSALDARGDGAGTALVAVGGSRAILGAVDTSGRVVPASATRVGAPIELPGGTAGSVPFPLVRDGRLQAIRFLRDAGRAEGALHLLAIDEGRVSDVGTLETAGRLPPLAMASTTSALLWAESSLAPIGDADLRVLVSSPECTTGAIPATVVHLPLGLGGGDPRALAATEADDRTYAFVVETEGFVTAFRAFLTVIDLGACRAGTPR